MQDFIYQVDTKILFGHDQLRNLSKEIKKYGNRVLICYGGGSIKKSGLYDKVIKELEENDIFYKELWDIEPNPRVESVKRGVEIVKKHSLNFILPVGGGSVIDCAKLVAAGAKVETDPWKIVIGEEIVKEALPIGAILTIAATGSEMDKASVITNVKTKQKLGWASKHVLPKFAIMNPEYTYTVPKYHTSAGVADIMSHTMENYFSLNDGCYMQDRMAEGILKTMIKYGPIAYNDPENYEARANIMWSNSWAINGLLGSGKSTAWSVHAMEHELSAYYDITHGIGLAILTPRWLKHVLNNETVEKIATFGKNVFEIEETSDKFEDANKAIDALYKFFKDEMHIPMTLQELDIDETHLRDMAKATIRHKNGPIKGFQTLQEEDVYEIYKMSL
ncbi:iron-containing alcohol dehydrogenase [Peptoniphilus stercorisuis]|uniref:Alcohol dehydrogenase YqhD (Iron-dependent ADH family) n=1 Tax=Peptoniphilus stercorisuis TaxID=1436965 RepID=A0ABS4KC72_9FIRM|nr:iron-containing alcohol dehydrogenase [Peptoniphilus stercorisuis]MBP2024861.1 alcohol dehydrogenase YqhD (iron-dependent ADH family) [Peptoniphilus stercorisuis]